MSTTLYLGTIGTSPELASMEIIKSLITGAICGHYEPAKPAPKPPTVKEAAEQGQPDIFE